MKESFWRVVYICKKFHALSSLFWPRASLLNEGFHPVPLSGMLQSLKKELKKRFVSSILFLAILLKNMRGDEAERLANSHVKYCSNLKLGHSIGSFSVLPQQVVHWIICVISIWQGGRDCSWRLFKKEKFHTSRSMYRNRVDLTQTKTQWLIQGLVFKISNLMPQSIKADWSPFFLVTITILILVLPIRNTDLHSILWFYFNFYIYRNILPLKLQF